ncbi:hypothetical protein RB213_015544, partial [Colletotrichum asianum]
PDHRRAQNLVWSAADPCVQSKPSPGRRVPWRRLNGTCRCACGRKCQSMGQQQPRQTGGRN